MYSITMKKYAKILNKLKEDLDDETVNRLEEELEELYFDLTEDEVSIIESESNDETDTEEDDE